MSFTSKMVVACKPQDYQTLLKLVHKTIHDKVILERNKYFLENNTNAITYRNRIQHGENLPLFELPTITAQDPLLIHIGFASGYDLKHHISVYGIYNHDGNHPLNGHSGVYISCAGGFIELNETMSLIAKYLTQANFETYLVLNNQDVTKVEVLG